MKDNESKGQEMVETNLEDCVKKAIQYSEHSEFAKLYLKVYLKELLNKRNFFKEFKKKMMSKISDNNDSKDNYYYFILSEKTWRNPNFESLEISEFRNLLIKLSDNKHNTEIKAKFKN
ncbi:MAG: hypothetical protein K6F77_09205, partial [Lachnospiraceae bacterium]|nr:hypothetical protein [Lachnospiraceae bacterium]